MTETQSKESTMIGEILRFQVCRMAKIESRTAKTQSNQSTMVGF